MTKDDKVETIALCIHEELGIKYELCQNIATTALGRLLDLAILNCAPSKAGGLVLELTGPRQKKSRGTETTQKFCESFESHHGRPYKFQGAKDGKILAGLVEDYGEEKVHEIIDRFHDMEADQFLRRRGYDVPALKGNFQGLLLDKQVAGPRPAREVTQQEIDEAAEAMRNRPR